MNWILATVQRCGISKQQKKKQISRLYKKVHSKNEVWKGKFWYIEQVYYLYISEALHRMQVKKVSTLVQYTCVPERLWTDQTTSGYKGWCFSIPMRW